MTAPVSEDIREHSVTAGDIFHYLPGSGGVASFVLPFFWWSPAYVGGLEPELPMYWSEKRDAMLRKTVLHESFWAAAVTISAVKAASKGFDFDGPPRLISRAQEMMVQWSGQGYVPSQEKGVQDFMCTDNGEFHEIVRVSNARGSKILGLAHLDSGRCQRTGDPEIPVLYRDLAGYLHELRDYQVVSLSDMPDPGASWFGVGHCAASRAYPHIIRLAAIERYFHEKITGAGASKLTILRGITTEQLRNLIDAKEKEKTTKGLIYYQGSIIAGILGDMNLEKVEVELRGLPENFDRKQELDIALLAYADAAGLDPQDLQPLSPQGFGTGTQSRVLFEKAKGKGLASRDKQLTHLLNTWVFPERVTFSWNERDLTDELQQATVTTTRADARAKMIANGEITNAQSMQLAADAHDIPQEFIPADLTPDEQVSDEERVTDETEPTAATAAPPVVAPTVPAAVPKPTTKGSRLADAITYLAQVAERIAEAK